MPRDPDPLWDVMDELFGFCRTRTEASRRGKAVKELRDAGATVEEVRVTYAYCKRFPSFTEMAVVSHLSAALHAAQQVAAVDATIDRILGGTMKLSDAQQRALATLAEKNCWVGSGQYGVRTNTIESLAGLGLADLRITYPGYHYEARITDAGQRALEPNLRPCPPRGMGQR